MIIKCLTLTQPWATLVACGAKSIETRSWGTSYRGPLAIHAAKGLADMSQADFNQLCASAPFAAALATDASLVQEDEQGGRWLVPGLLPRGAVLAIGELVDVVRIGPARPKIPDHGTWERAFGDYQPGRYMWHLANVRRLPAPVPARGHLALWPWPVPPEVAQLL